MPLTYSVIFIQTVMAKINQCRKWKTSQNYTFDFVSSDQKQLVTQLKEQTSPLQHLILHVEVIKTRNSTVLPKNKNNCSERQKIMLGMGRSNVSKGDMYFYLQSKQYSIILLSFYSRHPHSKFVLTLRNFRFMQLCGEIKEH